MNNITQSQRQKFMTGLNVSRETSDRLDHLVGQIAKWSPKINLVAKNTLSDIWDRHISDSAQLLSATTLTDGKWLDIGSGGGFPGLVVAILAAEYRKDFQFILVESDLRKCVFLETIIRELGLGAEVQNARIENLSPQNARVISARAIAPLPKLLDLAVPHLGPGGVCLFLKGQNHLSELTESLLSWKLSYDILKSRTDPQAGILHIHEAIRV